MMRTVQLACIFGALAFPAFAVRPGRVLPVRPQVPLAQVGATGSLVAPDGSVFLKGNFTAVNGVPRPGLARVTPEGRVEVGFRPTAIEIAGEATLPTISLLPMAANPGGFLLTGGGTLLYASAQRLLAYRPDGRMDYRFDALHVPGSPLSPLFEDSGRIYCLRRSADGQRMETYRCDSLAPIPLPGQAAWPVPVSQAAPAAGGRVWILGRAPSQPGLYLPDFSPYTLFRILPDGAVDPSFAPLELSGACSHRIAPRGGGGYQLVSHNISYQYFWPTPTSLDYRVDRFAADGVREYTHRIVMPRGHSLVLAEEPDGALIHNLASSWNVDNALVRLFPDGTRDPAFRIPLHAPALKRLDDGRLQHGHLSRSLPDGSPDPGWRVPRLSTDPSVRIIDRFADGAILANLSGPSPVGALSQNPVIFDRALRVDPAFRLPAELPPIHSFRRSADGQTVVAALRCPYTFPDGTSTRLVRLLRDGSIDPDSPRYLPPSNTIVFVSTEHRDTTGALPFAGDFNFHPLADGRFLVNYCLPGGDVDVRIVARIWPDGSPDETFQFAGQRFGCGGVTVLADGAVLADNALYTPDGAFRAALPDAGYCRLLAELPGGHLLLRCYVDGNYRLVKWHPDTGTDPAFSGKFPGESSISLAVPVNGGDVIVCGALATASGQREMVRLRADGRIDPTFRAPPALRVLPRPRFLRTLVRGEDRVPASLANRTRPAQITSLMYLADRDAVLVAGEFTHLGQAPRRGLAVLALGRPASFADWAEAAIPGPYRHPSADPDGDGDANLLEYLLGSDPTGPDRPPALQPVPGNPRLLRLPVNPNARGVRPLIEVSTDLLSWRPATDNELPLEDRGANHLTWRVRLPASPRFYRLRAVETPP